MSAKRFEDMDDSEKIQDLDIVLKQVKDLQDQIDTLTQALKNKQNQISNWKDTAVAKFINLENRVSTLESV